MLSLPGRNWLLGYGGLPNFTEFDASGHVLFDGTLGSNVQNFNTFLSPWSGRPTTPPSLAVQPSGAGTVSVAASWNGATEVASWRVLAGSSPSSLTSVASAAKARLSDHDRAPHGPALRRRAGARRLRCGHRRIAGDHRLRREGLPGARPAGRPLA